MSIREDQAQAELRRAYVGGGPGAVVSGIVWLVAGLLTTTGGIKPGFAALFVGGFFIFPLGTLIVRTVFRRSAPPPGNRQDLLVLETLPSMLTGLLAAWLILPYQPDWVFPLAALAVGGHYFGFRSAYGDRTYWLLGATMCLIGAVGIFTKWLTLETFPFSIAAVEIAFGIALTWVSVSAAE